MTCKFRLCDLDSSEKGLRAKEIASFKKERDDKTKRY